MAKTIAVFGATGLIGKSLSRALIDRGDDVIVFSRSIEKGRKVVPGASNYVQWTPDGANWQSTISNVDAVVNLAGENVMAKRWDDKHKSNVRVSRILGTRAIVEAIADAEKKPGVFISASATGYYGTSPNDDFTENSSAGDDFLAKLTAEWESEARRVKEYGIRYSAIRTGIVLDKNEGALARMLTPFKFFVGGPLGNGEQWFPWIHVDDVVGIFLHALDNEIVDGALNAVSPQPVTMKGFCLALGDVMKRPSFFNVPAFVLKILFGEGAAVLLNGAKVIPAGTIKAGYKFKYKNLDAALKSIIK